MLRQFGNFCCCVVRCVAGFPGEANKKAGVSIAWAKNGGPARA